MENEGSLRVLLFEVFHGLRAKDPVFCLNVGLENSRSEVLFTFGVEDILHVLKQNELLLNFIIHVLHLCLSLV